MSTGKNSGAGASTLGLLGIAFIILKLCHVINWSWWWVTAPFWGMIALAVLFFIVYFICQIIIALRERQ